MNPTGRNIGAHRNWQGIRAPWIGTKTVWKMLYDIKLFNDAQLIQQISNKRPEEWDPNFVHKVYSEVAKNSVYITKIAKCTQLDARPLPNSTFKVYLNSLLDELTLLKAQHIIAFGNQVSSILLDKSISVSDYLTEESAEITLSDGSIGKIFPTYYPVGQGRRNMPLAIERIQHILNL